MNTDPTRSHLEILVAEDSPTQAEQLKYILEEHDFRAIITRNGKEALEAMHAHKPTLVITDINMPQIDGYELCRRIRADERLADMPVILLTSLSDPEDVFKGLECGADNFITKPYEKNNLLARIHYLLANVHLRSRERMQISIEVFFAGRRHVITSDRAQILNLLLSTYETAVQKNRELTKARDDLEKLNEQLTTANRDLEAFSYSVSHDLRAPLRHVLGFAGILRENAASQLDEENQRHLQTILKSVMRMGELIDDLLDFSRTGRAEIRMAEISLDQVVKDSLQDLENEVKERNITWKIGPLGEVRGDPSMLRQVMVNLIGNALKFTRTRAQAEIEIGRISGKENEIVVFVRDNGAGFDMNYAKKLFGVFQRLHRQEDFEGTGIGLANVQRIIQRHGGRAWAEGIVNSGATFYFSLPRQTGGSS
jgi:signal transduction histidine kinase